MKQDTLQSALMPNNQAMKANDSLQRVNSSEKGLQSGAMQKSNSQNMIRNESGLSFHMEGENESSAQEQLDLENGTLHQNPLFTPEKEEGPIPSSPEHYHYEPITAIHIFYLILSSSCNSLGALLSVKLSNGWLSVLELMFYRSLATILFLFILYKLSKYFYNSFDDNNNAQPFKDIAFIQNRERKYVQIYANISALTAFSYFYGLSILHLQSAFTLLNISIVVSCFLLQFASHKTKAISSSLQNSNSSNKQGHYQMIAFSNNSSSNQKQDLTNQNPFQNSDHKPIQNDNKLQSNAILTTPIQDKNKVIHQHQEDTPQTPQQYHTTLNEEIQPPSPKKFLTPLRWGSIFIITIGACLVAAGSLNHSISATLLCFFGGSTVSGTFSAIARSKSWRTSPSTLLFYGSFVQLLISPLLIAMFGAFHALSLIDCAELLGLAILQIACTRFYELSQSAQLYQSSASILISIVLNVAFLREEFMIIPLIGQILIILSSGYLQNSVKMLTIL